jgi:nucleoside-diphosphate-sugar epimerase
VKDTCKGFSEIANSVKTVGEEINIASNYEVSMKDTLELIAKIMKSDVTFIEDTNRLRPKNSEVFRLWGDNKKISNLTGFKIDYDLEKGLGETINWFLKPENLARYKTNIYNV